MNKLKNKINHLKHISKMLVGVIRIFFMLLKMAREINAEILCMELHAQYKFNAKPKDLLVNDNNNEHHTLH